ncbi:hypothetical protein DNK48_01195 [Streptomyces malaysiensis subsp. malaysiensis]|nr:hypothetical protein DNK48_01195 [Streptomyces malaysiensis]
MSRARTRPRASVRPGAAEISVLGGISESERQHVQARVRAGKGAQVVNEGPCQGSRHRARWCSGSVIP